MRPPLEKNPAHVFGLPLNLVKTLYLLTGPWPFVSCFVSYFHQVREVNCAPNWVAHDQGFQPEPEKGCRELWIDNWIKETARVQLTFILRPPIIITCFVLKYIRLYYISNDDAQLAIVESLGRYEESIWPAKLVHKKQNAGAYNSSVAWFYMCWCCLSLVFLIKSAKATVSSRYT